MTQCASGSQYAPPPSLATPRRLARWVCTSNPFYVLSALLVCLGLWLSFGAQHYASQTWALLAGMAGYTLLLAATACLLVRLVGAWDDVRTIMLLVVLLILATSVTFDEVLVRDPARGLACYLFGLLIAAVVSEVLLRGCRLALPPLYRIPYHLSLALFFLYPVALMLLLDWPRSEALAWSLFGFSPAAGLVALSLLPAIRRGRGYIGAGGSPWPWAWYPWTPFGVLAFGVVARSALLCWSMHHIERSTAAEPYIFGAYFLVPFLLAVGVLLLEIGLVERHAGVRSVALGVPVLLVILALVGHRPEPAYHRFLEGFTARLGGTSLYLTLVASAAFYAYAGLRRIRLAIGALSATLVGLAFVAPSSLGLVDLVPPRPLPLLVLAGLQLAIGLRRRHSGRCLAGAGCLAIAAVLAAPAGGAAPIIGRGVLAYHLLLMTLLAVGAAFDDTLGRVARGVGAGATVMGCLAVIATRPVTAGGLPPWAAWAYPLVMAALLAAYGRRLHDWVSRRGAGLILGAWLVALAWRGYDRLRPIVAGLDFIALGMVLFAVAVLTSLVKAGVKPGRFPKTWDGVRDSLA